MRSDIEMAGVETGAHLETAEEASLARTLRALSEIDQRHAPLPECWLCGQKTLRPDTFGLCSKISPDHLTERQRRDTA